jgi:hypothetical protein
MSVNALPDLEASISVDCHGEVLAVGDRVEVAKFGFIDGHLPCCAVVRVVTNGEDGRFFRLFYRVQGAWIEDEHGQPWWLAPNEMRKVPRDN